MEFLVDTNVFLYARGAAHPQRYPCRAVLRAAASGAVTLTASVELVQEFAHVLLRRGHDRATVMDEVDEVRSQCRLRPFDADVLARACTLLRGHHHLGVRDAVHAATAQAAGIGSIISVDRVFDQVTGISRVDPASPALPWSGRD